jgi:hypothetical protein
LNLLYNKILPRLDLPKDLRLFGPETAPLTRLLADRIMQQVTSGAIDRLTLFLTDPPSRWDVAEWPALRAAVEAGKLGVPVAIVLRWSDVHVLEMSQKLDLVRLAARSGATVHGIEQMPARKLGRSAIRPVEHNSSDSVRNELAMSGTLHWMFYRGLIVVANDNEIILVSRNKVPGDVVDRLLRPDGKIWMPKDNLNWPHSATLVWHQEHIFGQMVAEGPAPWE